MGMIIVCLHVIMQNTSWSAIFFASKEGNLKTVQELLAHGASVNLKDEVTYLHSTSHG